MFNKLKNESKSLDFLVDDNIFLLNKEKYKYINDLITDKTIYDLKFEVGGVFDKKTKKIYELVLPKKKNPLIIEKIKFFPINHEMISFHTHPLSTNIRLVNPNYFKKKTFEHFDAFPSKTDIQSLLNAYFSYNFDVNEYICSQQGICYIRTNLNSYNNLEKEKIKNDIIEISEICNNIAIDAILQNSIEDIIKEYKKYIDDLDFLKISFKLY